MFYISELNLFIHRSFSEGSFGYHARGSASDLSSLIVRIHVRPGSCSVELWAITGVGKWSIFQAVPCVLIIYRQGLFGLVPVLSEHGCR